MGGGNMSVVGDAPKEEDFLDSSMENDEVLCVEENEKQQSSSPDWAAISPPPPPAAEDLSAGSPVAVSKSKLKAPAGASKAPNMPRKKTGKNNGVRGKLLSYTPGSFLGKKADKFKIPEVTTLLVVGLRGAGKSAVINRIIRVMDAEASRFYRAPLAGNSDESGTHFLSEYSICNGSVSLFDTRGFTEWEVAEGMTAPEEWMTEGVRDGQMELWAGDAKFLQEEVKLRGRHVDHMLSQRRDVNFVIFVVNAAHFMDRRNHGDIEALAKMQMLYKNPFFSFRDDRPVLVATHMDELTAAERVEAQFALAEHFKVPAIDLVYDISGTTELDRDEEIVAVRDNSLEMLTTALQRADRYLPQKRSVLQSFIHTFSIFWSHVRNSDQLKIYLKITTLYLFLVSFIFFCIVLLRAQKSLMHLVDNTGEGNTVTINLRWLGKKIRF